jgi:transketolase
MRKEFCAWLESYAGARSDVVVLTGDLGFQALEPVRARIGPRFVNMGVSEQNLISAAAGMASEGLNPICYSIAPFAVFRPAEQIRLDVCLHQLNVKIVGNGGGYGYGIMGATHHALEDIAVLSSFPGLSCFVPVTGGDVATTADAMVAHVGPAYLRLNMGALPDGYSMPGPFAPVRRIEGPRSGAPKLTVVALGPIVLNALRTASPHADWFVVSQLPLPSLPGALLESIAVTQRVLVLEEHVERGGLAEHLSLALLKQRLAPKIWTRSARGYPSKRYGSQAFHQRESGLDTASLTTLIQECIDERA